MFFMEELLILGTTGQVREVHLVELQLQMMAGKEVQRELTTEVGDLKEKLEMTREMLEESRVNVRNLERKLSPKAHIATPSHAPTPALDEVGRLLLMLSAWRARCWW